MNLTRPIDFDEFCSASQDNLANALNGLKKLGHWRHFENASLTYNVLMSHVSQDDRGKVLPQIHVYNLNGCIANLPKGLWMAHSGQLVDSHFYVRRTIEAVRASCFVRENPEYARDWYGETKEAIARFKREQQSWLKKYGRAILREELPTFNEMYDHTSTTGLHANAVLAGFQTDIIREEKGASLRLKFHDTDPSPDTNYNIVALFYLHLRIHFEAIDWWMNRSGLSFDLTRELRDLWFQQKKEFKRSMHAFIESIPKHMWPSDMSNGIR